MLRRGWGVAEEPWRNSATKRSHLAAFKCASANACLNATVEVAVASIMDKTTLSGTGVCTEGFAGFLCSHCAEGFSTSQTGGTVEACSPCDSSAEVMQAVAWVLVFIVGIIVGLALALWLAQRPATDTADKLGQLSEVQAEAKILFGNTNRFLADTDVRYLACGRLV